MSIKSDVDELQKIIAEIKRTAEMLKKLRSAKVTVESRITAFLKEKDLPGVKYNGDVILLKQTTTNKSKPKKLRQNEIIDLFINFGVSAPEELLKKINTIGKEKIVKEGIKIDKGN